MFDIDRRQFWGNGSDGKEEVDFVFHIGIGDQGGEMANLIFDSPPKG